MVAASDRVCAVVVTYHPNSEVLANLAAIRDQAGCVVVVDNGSSPAELEPLRQAPATRNFELIENNENLGIASALNIGVRRAIELRAEWILLFDQDSRVTPGFVQAMVAGFRTSPWGGHLGILVPVYTDGRLGTPLPSNRVQRGLEAAMTSGSLLRPETFSRCGFFLDELFIDGVDYEYSLRLRRAGYVIDECPGALLLHSPGEPCRLRLFGLLNYQTANYSPVRHYYQQRNKVWIVKRYLAAFPVFCLRLAMFSSKDFFKIIFGEADKLRKLRFFVLGAWDGLHEQMGPCRLR